MGVSFVYPGVYLYHTLPAWVGGCLGCLGCLGGLEWVPSADQSHHGKTTYLCATPLALTIPAWMGWAGLTF